MKKLSGLLKNHLFSIINKEKNGTIYMLVIFVVYVCKILTNPFFNKNLKQMNSGNKKMDIFTHQ